MILILEGLLKGLVLWLYGMILEGVNTMANALLDVFNMDLSYFEQYAPVTSEIVQIIIASGWALLLGNMAFQAMRSMAAGIGFEGEDPQILFTRTFVFGFLLVASRQICEIGLSITATVMGLLRIPDSVVINTPDKSMLGAFDDAWIWMVIIGIILIWQIVKFFFEIGERYVVLAILTIMAPLAFGMGCSKNTEDIFKGWVRMYGSMCVMLLMNVVFLKLLLSAMSTVPSGFGLIPWLIFVVAIARVGRKMDDLVCRIGLNPARTGDPLGRGVPVMVSMMVAKGIGKMVANTAAANKPGPKPANGAAGAASGSPRPGPAGPAGGLGGTGGGGNQHRGSTYSSHSSSTAGEAAAMGGAVSAVGQTAGAATNAVGQSVGHAAGQSPAQRQPQSQGTRQESSSQGRTPAGQPMGGQPGQGGQSVRPARTRPVNIDVEYDEPQAQASVGAMPSHGAPPNLSSPTSPTKAAEQNPSRPPIQRTPRGNFPQTPVGASTTPHMRHSSSQTNSSTASTSSSQATQMAGSASGPPKPSVTLATGSVNVQGANNTQTTSAQKPAQPPLTGRRSAGAGFDRGTQPQGATRPPIGHNATINHTSQESPSPSPRMIDPNNPSYDGDMPGVDYGDLSFTDGGREVIYYNQMDERWCNEMYGKSQTIGYGGCGPTAMAMVVSTLTETTINPKEMADWANENGYCCEGNGSYHSLIPGAATAYGLSVEGAGRGDAQKIVDALADGKLVVALMSPGHFTTSGHFIVLRGVTAEGKLLVADPVSYSKSQQEWDANIVWNEARHGAAAGGPFWIIG